MALILEHIEAGYGPTTVLRGVSLSVERGTCAALLGGNGAGKTTLLRVAAGTKQPISGQVLLDRDDITAMPGHARVRRGLCFIPEVGGTFGRLSVRDNLLLFSERFDAGLERAFGVFPDLRGRFAQPAATLSGGEQQMLALCRVVIQRSSVVLLDDVSAGLSPRWVDWIFRFVNQLVTDGAAVLLVDRHIARSLAIADTVEVLDGGKIAFSGPPADLPPDLAARHLA